MTDSRSPTVGAVVLAAGFGTRLAPLTDTTPKPLIEVGGRPVASHLAARLQELRGLQHLVVVTNDQHPEQWRTWQGSFASNPPHVLSNGVRLEEDRKGAVSDMAFGLAALQKLGQTDWIVVLAGDNLLDESLAPHLEAAVAGNTPIVLCRDLGADVPPGRFGEITTDASGVVTRFREKPSEPESPLAATCSYVFDADVHDEILAYLQDGEPDSPGMFVSWLAARRAVQARALSGRYFDIGNHQTLADARQAYS